MEREVMLAGVGGQGVQLAAQVLARAATAEGRHVMSLGTYGGTMRGGNTEAVVVIGDGPIQSPPIVSRVWAALVVHPRFWAPVREKLVAGSSLWVDADRFDEDAPEAVSFFPITAAQLAEQAGARAAASLVLVSAFCAGTGLVGIDALCEAMAASLPPYRHAFLAKNQMALRAGYVAAPTGAPAAWSPEDTTRATTSTPVSA